MNIKEASNIVGNLSNPEKMPCYSYNLPAVNCKVGSILVKVAGTVCFDCYALKGRYMFPNVKLSMQRHLESIESHLWVKAMVFLLKNKRSKHIDSRYFRWHDSGDVQHMKHLLKIVAIAAQCPEIRFWLPTKEFALIRQFLRSGRAFPANLTVRVSMPKIGQAPKEIVESCPTSTVSAGKGFTCKAPKQDNFCLDCRACWSKKTSNIDYKIH